ncbi:MAG: 2-dehydro-3-deoxy-6-phosphogalactonate aldolase [Rhizomicrobium sp.]|jgi:2-dehydro-3-deoxyphosphogalactonate aldolase
MHPSLAPDGPVLIAILRGITPARIAEVARILFDGGIRVIEVPLNSPDPFQSIARLAHMFGDACLCGAGTVLGVADVARVKEAGGRLIVTPNADPRVIAEAVTQGLTVMPGFGTATEAFSAINGGAAHLKLFPAGTFGPGHLKALRAVLPRHIPVYAVGGIGAAEIPKWIAAGAAGFGMGSELFKPDYSDEEIAQRARTLVEAVAQSIHT